MVKVIVLLARRVDLSREEFRRYLDEEHLPLVKRLPGLERLVINYVLPGLDGAAPAYDAVAEDWFESPEAVQAALASPEGQAVNADVPNFADVGRLAVLVAEECVVVPAGCQNSVCPCDLGR